MFRELETKEMMVIDGGDAMDFFYEGGKIVGKSLNSKNWKPLDESTHRESYDNGYWRKG